MANADNLDTLGVRHASGLKSGLNVIQAAVDTTPPVLNSLIIPASINLANGNAPLFIRAGATDVGSGVASVMIELDNFIAYDVKIHGGTLGAFVMDGQDDSWSDGLSSQTYTIASNNKPGDYHVLRVQVIDNAGNSTSYEAAQLKAMGVNTTISVLATADTAPPTVLSFTPAATGNVVQVNGDLVFTFSEAIQAGTGKIILRDGAGNVAASIDAAGPGISIAGNTLSIHPGTTLAFDSNYTISLPAGSIKDLAGNSYAGSSASSAYAFWTASNPAQVGLTINGTDGNDVLTGSNLNDNISAGAGNDRIIASPGNDSIFGDSGLDTLVLSGKMANYTVSGTPAYFILKDNFGNDGTDSVGLVERLQFTDVTLAFDLNGVAGQAYRLYQAAFGHKPDQAGLGYWIQTMDKGASLNAVAAAFVQSAEFQQLYGANPSTTTLINNFYQNVLHRAPDQAGFDYWSNQINQGLVTPAAALASFCESAESQAQVLGQIQQGIVYTMWVG
ncbi:DUF4214 domain-containing protein [Undibacterium sp. Tian12W]|uniref:DUF4214 domain-containing protein n=1 Tax=Undibacterium sp. Tian12W TaxID=3413054 RepID=UPI003BEFB078